MSKMDYVEHHVTQNSNVVVKTLGLILSDDGAKKRKFFFSANSPQKPYAKGKREA
jgi:hypothetical protein